MIKIKNNHGTITRINNFNNNCRVVECSGLNGKTITITNGVMLVDGMPIEEFEKQQHCQVSIKVVVEGNCESIENCESVEVTGDCSIVSTMSGDVHCNNVKGSVRTMSGDVICSTIGGSVSTMSGDIIKR